MGFINVSMPVNAREAAANAKQITTAAKAFLIAGMEAALPILKQSANNFASADETIHVETVDNAPGEQLA